jgi:hypothetical protein
LDNETKKKTVDAPLNRTVPNWAKGILFALCAGTFVKMVTEANQNPWHWGGKVAYLLGSLISLVLMFFALHWLIGWCFFLIRIALTRDQDEYDSK